MSIHLRQGDLVEVRLKKQLHHFPVHLFGSTKDLVCSSCGGEQDTLLIACSGQGFAPDQISLNTSARIVIWQNLAASVPSSQDCILHGDLFSTNIEKLFDQHQFRHMIVCGNTQSLVIRHWLNPTKRQCDKGLFQTTFDQTVRRAVDKHYVASSAEERCTFMVCEHVLHQIENLISHNFVARQIQEHKTNVHAWIVDDSTARILSYHPAESSFVRI